MWYTKPIFIRAFSLYSFPEYWIIILRLQCNGAPKWFRLIDFLQQTALKFGVRVKTYVIPHWPKNVNTIIPKPSLTFKTSNVQVMQKKYCMSDSMVESTECNVSGFCWQAKCTILGQRACTYDCLEITMSIINSRMPSLLPGYGTGKPCLWQNFCVCVSLSSAIKNMLMITEKVWITQNISKTHFFPSNSTYLSVN